MSTFNETAQPPERVLMTERVFRYGWRTLAVNLAGVLFLVLFGVFLGFNRLVHNPWALVVILLGSSLLVARFLLECRNPRELRISGGELHFEWRGQQESIPLSELDVLTDDASSMFLDYVKISWGSGSFLVFSHISDFSGLKKEISPGFDS
jgi:hypothetical protein